MIENSILPLKRTGGAKTKKGKANSKYRQRTNLLIEIHSPR